MTAVYLSLKQVGERLGVKNAAAYRLPERRADGCPRPSTDGTPRVRGAA